jgi:RND family efflux transporter MFP subunit
MKRIVVPFVVLAIVGCAKRDAPPAAAPAAAKASHPVSEASLNTITVTDETEKRLGITVAMVERKSVPSVRVVAGEVVVPPGGTIDVISPIAGTVASAGSGAPVAGRAVRQGDVLYRIVPLLPADRDLRINAERDLAAARAALQAAQQRLTRAETLLKDGSGSRRAAEEARADMLTSQATLDAAQERVGVVNRSQVNQSNELVVHAPLNGVVETVGAQPGQTVSASAPLVRIARIDRLWVRVPVYAGDVRNIDAAQGASIIRLGEGNDAPGVPARRVAAPPTSTPTAAAVDLTFELPSSAALQPGERVNVRLVQKGAEIATVVPHSALLHDIHGGTWVYVRTAPHAYARQRVEVQDVVGNAVLLSRGPAVNTPVVSTGAAELYGVEFGVGK